MEKSHAFRHYSVVTMIHTLKDELHYFDKVRCQLFIFLQCFQWEHLFLYQQRSQGQIELDETINDNFFVPFFINLLGHLFENRPIPACFLLKKESLLPNFLRLLRINLYRCLMGYLVLFVLKVVDLNLPSQLIHRVTQYLTEDACILLRDEFLIASKSICQMVDHHVIFGEIDFWIEVLLQELL